MTAAAIPEPKIYICYRPGQSESHMKMLDHWHLILCHQPRQSESHEKETKQKKPLAGTKLEFAVFSLSDTKVLVRNRRTYVRSEKVLVPLRMPSHRPAATGTGTGNLINIDETRNANY